MKSWLIPCLLAWLLIPTNHLLHSQMMTNHRQVDGIYPHLAMWNDHGECGTGAVLPWADRLWAITYAPHQPNGSTDKLYAIDNRGNLQVLPESVGGTPANRMIHLESQQAIIGPYLIDRQGNVRVISPQKMPGRLTGVARHLFDPENKVYFATMEEGIYEVDVHTLEVNPLFYDDQGQIGNRNSESAKRVAKLPGYHGKGLYSGQGRLIYANNGESSAEARARPDVPSGCLAEWDGISEDWKIIRRNQFTDVCGPGGLTGNQNPAEDPVWSIGWDHRSLILMLLDHGKWSAYRLPKASHCYDGAHGWNTEWPRFRKVDDNRFLLNMHGMFWDFPTHFSRTHSAGIRPRSTYLKVVGDFCRWQEQLVLGCDDTAANEFLNTRKAKGKIAGPGQSHSNLWFISPDRLDNLGTPQGTGAVWLHDAADPHQPSDPFLFSGFQRRQLAVSNHTTNPVKVVLEFDQLGNDQWEVGQELQIPAHQTHWHFFPQDQLGTWIRLRVQRNIDDISAHFSMGNESRQTDEWDSIFDGLAALGQPRSAGRLRVRGEHLKTLAMVSLDDENQPNGFYQLDEKLELSRNDDPEAMHWTDERLQFPGEILNRDDASVIFVDDDNRRWRLPFASDQWRSADLSSTRIAREVVTERDLFQCAGTFYELPARNAGGMQKVRPIASPQRAIVDYCSYRGLMAISGLKAEAPASSQVIVADDGKARLWLGSIDQLWKMPKPIGTGGPWFKTRLSAGATSDPYLFHGFDHKSLTLEHASTTAVSFDVLLDVHGTGEFVTYQTLTVPPGKSETFPFPDELSAYWLKLRIHQPAIATATLRYW